MNNLTVALEPREDRHANIYYVGRKQFPGYLDCSEGIAIFIFNSESGEEEIQIACVDKGNPTFSRFTKRNDRVNVDLESRDDQYGKKYFHAKLQMSGMFDAHKGITFLVFTSKEGAEELQIVGELVTEHNAASSGHHRAVNIMRVRTGNRQ